MPKSSDDARPVTEGISGASIRLAQSTDAQLLQGFTCATSPDEPGYEVQEQIQHEILTWSTQQPAEDRRLLLLVDDVKGELLGVGAHKKSEFYEEDPQRPGRSIYLIAIASSHHGRVLEDVRCSDALLRELVDDILLRDGDVPITAIIHRTNVSSQKLFSRNNFFNAAPWPGSCIIVW